LKIYNINGAKIMRRLGNLRDKNLEQIVEDILKSRARSRIYVYLLRKKGAKTEQIIKGTKLHPSTVRETLSKMYAQKQIYRKKIQNDHIGKNPYIYYPIPPIELLKRHTQEIEDRLNKLAILTISKNERKNRRPIRIKIIERADKT
jgi:predicted DNA-binding transcriptional regulator